MTGYKKIFLIIIALALTAGVTAQTTIFTPANVSNITVSDPIASGSTGDLINGDVGDLFYLFPPASDSVSITFQLVKPDKVVAYDIYFYDAGYSSSSIILSGSNDGSSWTALDNEPGNTQKLSASFSNTASYSYYRFVFKGFSDGFGLLALSEIMAYNGTLSTPPALTAAPRTGNQVNLSWTPVIRGNGSYELYRSPDDINFNILKIVSQSVTSYTDTLSDTTATYWYKVRASNDIYNSPYSDTVKVTDSLRAPVLSATPGTVGTKVNLSWNLVIGTTGQFALEKSVNGTNFTLLKTFDKSVTAYTDTTLANATTYWYRIKGINYVGASPYSDTVKVTTVSDTLTNIPVLTGTAPTGTQAALSWNFTFNTPAPGKFELQQSTDGVNFTLFGKLDASVNAYTEESLTPNTSYWFRIRATNYLSTSQWSDTVQVTTNGITSSPADITDDGGSLHVSAENSGGANAAEGSSHLIDNNVYSKWLVFTAQDNGDLSAVYKPTGSYIVTSYALATAGDAPPRDPKSWTFSGSNDSSTWVTLDTRSGQGGGVTPRNTTYSYSLANPGTVAYKFYRINFTANNGATDGVRFQVSEWQIFGIDGSAPDLPNPLQVTGTTVSTISLSWNEGMTNPVNKFRLQRSADGIYYTTLVDSLPVTPLTYTDNNLPDSATYYYRMQAIGARPTAITGWSNVAQGTTSFTAGIPLVPGNLSASFISDTVISLAWIDRSFNETGFKLERSSDSVTFTQIDTLPVNATSVNDSAVSPGTVYFYRVRSYNGNGASAYSNVLKVTTTGGNNPPMVTVPIIYRKICGGKGDYNFSFTGIVPGPHYEDGQKMKVTSVTADSVNFFTGFTFSPDVTGGLVNYGFTTSGVAATGDSATIMVTVKDDGGTLNFGVDSAVLAVKIYFVPYEVSITADRDVTNVPRYALVTLTAGSSAPDNSSYVWNNAGGIEGADNLLILRVRPTQATTYTVTGTTSQGCQATAQITVTPQDSAVISNVLTPNGDGKNDRWIIWGIQDHPHNSVKVFDRAGRMVLFKQNYSNDWDGTYNGRALDEGAYFYVVDYGDGQKPATGMLTIIRDHK